MVWTFAIPTGRLVLLKPRYRYKLRARPCSDHPRRDIDGLKTPTTNPAVLYANHDARQVALKVYSPAFAFHLGHPIYFDFERDSIGIYDPLTFEAICLPPLQILDEKSISSELANEYDRVQSLVVFINCLSPFERFQSTVLHIFKLACISFRKLDEINFRGPLEKPWDDTTESKMTDLKHAAVEHHKALVECGLCGTTLAGEKIADPKGPMINLAFAAR